MVVVVLIADLIVDALRKRDVLEEERRGQEEGARVKPWVVLDLSVTIIPKIWVELKKLTVAVVVTHDLLN